MTQVVTIALGVAGGILLAAAIVVACHRWGRQALSAIHQATLWMRRQWKPFAALVLLAVGGFVVFAIADDARRQDQLRRAQAEHWRRFEEARAARMPECRKLLAKVFVPPQKEPTGNKPYDEFARTIARDVNATLKKRHDEDVDDCKRILAGN